MKTALAAGVLLLAAAACQAETMVETISRLRRDIFRNYDKDAIPLNNGSAPLDLKLGARMYNMKLTDQGELDFLSWMIFSWKDERLAWDGAKYPGIDALRLPPTELWIPDVEIYNNIAHGPGDFAATLKAGRHLALIYPDGTVLWIPPAHGKILCSDQDFANWPWGEYECALKIGSWTYSAKHINLLKYNDLNEISTKDMDPNSQVDFTKGSFAKDALSTDFYDCCPDEPYQKLDFEFKVQRKYKMTERGKKVNPRPAQYFISSGRGDF